MYFDNIKKIIKKMESKDLRTDGQRSRAERDAAICRAYNDLREQQPMVTRNRVLLAVAKDFGLVGQTVKVILQKNNAYV